MMQAQCCAAQCMQFLPLWTVSEASFHSLHLGYCLVWYTPASVDFVLSACSYSAMIRASVLSVNLAFSSHW